MLEKGVKSVAAERNLGLDLLKIIACFAVVVIHVAANKWYGVSYTSFEWNVFTVYDCVARWAVPVFVMISGALFLNADYSVERMYKKYILRIATAFLFWSCIYTAVNFYRYRSVPDALKLFFSGDYHMWYLFMIAGLYMITPLLRKLVEDEKLTRYFLILSSVFAFLIPEINAVILMFSEDAGRTALAIYDKLGIHFVLGYTFYYVLGYYFTKAEVSKKQFRVMACLGVLGIALAIGMTCAFTHYKGEVVKLFYDYLTVNVMLTSISVFSLYRRLNKISFSDRAKRIIVTMSKYSFGVYLVHVLIIYVLAFVFHFDTLSFNPIISVPVISIITTVGAYLISAVLNKIPIINKYIV